MNAAKIHFLPNLMPQAQALSVPDFNIKRGPWVVLLIHVTLPKYLSVTILVKVITTNVKFD